MEHDVGLRTVTSLNLVDGVVVGTVASLLGQRVLQHRVALCREEPLPNRCGSVGVKHDLSE